MSAPVSLKSWLDTGLGFVYPEVCQICDGNRATVPEGFVCEFCRQKARAIKPPICRRCGLPYAGDITVPFECGNCLEMDFYFRCARSAVIAGELVLDVIHRYKYLRALWFEPFLAGLLLRECAPVLSREGCDMIVPVPLHSTKRREREFNQAERLGGWLSRATGIPMNTGLLQRVKPTQTQTLLDRPRRAANVSGAFSRRAGQRLNGGRVTLVDDVFTTGATTNACARVLLAAGADEVCVWTVARGL